MTEDRSSGPQAASKVSAFTSATHQLPRPRQSSKSLAGYLGECNNDWEHSYGVKIDTLAPHQPSQIVVAHQLLIGA